MTKNYMATNYEMNEPIKASFLPQGVQGVEVPAIDNIYFLKLRFIGSTVFENSGVELSTEKILCQ